MPHLFSDGILVGLWMGVLVPALVAVLLVVMTFRARSSQVIWFTAPAYVSSMLVILTFLAIGVSDSPQLKQRPWVYHGLGIAILAAILGGGVAVVWSGIRRATRDRPRRGFAVIAVGHDAIPAASISPRGSPQAPTD